MAKEKIVRKKMKRKKKSKIYFGMECQNAIVEFNKLPKEPKYDIERQKIQKILSKTSSTAGKSMKPNSSTPHHRHDCTMNDDELLVFRYFFVSYFKLVENIEPANFVLPSIPSVPIDAIM